jgi:hypothetical protein
MTRRLTAPELDAMLGRLTPELRAELRRVPNIAALGDQIGAARDWSVGLFERFEKGSVNGVPAAEVDEWIRFELLDTFITWAEGRGRTCTHAPDHRRPEPVFSAAWKPHLVVCARCMHLLDAVGDMDKTCDRCGHICAGVDTDDPIYTSTVWFGALAHMFGTCESCRPDLGAGAA